MHFANQVPYANIYILSLVYLLLLLLFETQFFWSKLMAGKISCFEITNFRALNTFTINSNISKVGVLIQITLCWKVRIQMDLSKNNCFSAEEAINYIPRTEKRKRYYYVKFWVLWVLILPHASNFIMETEDNSIQRQFYDSSNI